jgi:hypothetical protein
VLVIGAFMIGMIYLVADRPAAVQTRLALRHSAIALAVMLGTLLLMRVGLLYDPIATFKAAWVNQHALLARYADQRPYPQTILFDLTDFTLGSGWISVLLLAFYLVRPDSRQRAALVVMAIVQLVIVAVAALLQSETARVWNFMLPLLMIPVGLELSRWPRSGRVAALAMLSLLLIAIYQNMTFLL